MGIEITTDERKRLDWLADRWNPDGSKWEPPARIQDVAFVAQILRRVIDAGLAVEQRAEKDAERDAKEQCESSPVQQLILNHLAGRALLWGIPDGAGGIRHVNALPTAHCQPVAPTPAYPFGAWRVVNESGDGGVVIDRRDVVQLDVGRDKAGAGDAEPHVVGT